LIKSNFKSRFLFLLSAFLLLLAAPAELEALLQGNRVILIDDYDDRKPGQGNPDVVVGEKVFKKEGASLALAYDVSASGSSAYFSTKLRGKDGGPEGGVADLTGMSYLSFWMKAEGGSERLEFYVELHEDTTDDGKYIAGEDTRDRVPASGFVGQRSKEGWQKVVVPLSRFRLVRRWDRILEVALAFENKKRLRKRKVLIDNLLFGSNYPEGFRGKEIPMQNRVSSFKIGGNRITGSEMRLKRNPISLALALTFVDPYLEEVRFEESRDGGQEWRRIKSFYDQTQGGVYKTRWSPGADTVSARAVLIRAMGVSLFGGETELVGPHKLRFD